MNNLANTIYKIALVLTVIGAINWGLVGLANLDLVAAIFGTLSGLSRLIYILVGISGIYTGIYFFTRAGKA